MREEKIRVGDYLHVYNRGNRKIEIVDDYKDRWRFLKSLCFFNEERSIARLSQCIVDDWEAEKQGQYNQPIFNQKLPVSWPEKEPLVRIICFFLAPNHYHLLLKEIKEGGISKFMGKLGTGFTGYINRKQNVSGRLFQGPYQRKIINDMRYLQYLSVYIQVFNAFQLYPKGFKGAVANFDKAYKFALNFEFSSLSDFVGKRDLDIINKDVFADMFDTAQEYKKFSRRCLLQKDLRSILEEKTLEV